MRGFGSQAFSSQDLHLVGASKRSAFQTIRDVLPFLWPEKYPEMRFRVVMAFSFLILGRLANVYGPIVLKDIIDSLDGMVPAESFDLYAASGEIQPVLWLALIYGCTIMVPSIMVELRSAIFLPVSEFAQRLMALTTFRHLHDLSMKFHLDRKTGGLSRAMERGTRGLQQVIGLFAFNIAPTLFEISLVSIYLGVNYHPKYVAIILVAFVAYILFTLFFTEWRTKFRRQMVAQESRAMSIGVDSLLNFETVKYFGNERYEADRYDDALEGYMDAAIKSQNTLGLLNGGQVLVRVACQLAILVLAILDYADGNITTGEVVMLNAYMLQLFIPLGFLGSSYRMIRQSLIDMEYMFQILDVKPEISDKEDASELVVKGGKIEFDQVCFAYETERTIFNSLSFTVQSGSTVAIVGPSGAGKSTIARLLYRFYDVASGSVLIDGQKVSDITQVSLRKAVGIVPQDTILFNDTIGYNIRYGRPDATDEEVEAAARLAAIHDFILTLPAGYNTQVGERGLKLSGGEKQRVAIARTILKDPPVLLLDEATSALDIHTERDIQSALQNVAEGRTTLVIAHRLATVVNADVIIVLDKGVIIEKGNHEQLIEEDGLYARMWQRQQEAVEKLENLEGEELGSLLPGLDS